MTTQTNVATASAESTERAHAIAGLRALADFLQANPAVPVSPFGREYSIHVRAETDDAGRAEVDQIAAALGVPVRDKTGDGGHYWAAKSFGHVTYRAVFVSAPSIAAYDALMSYAPAFKAA